MNAATLGLLLTRLGRLNEQFLTDHHRRHGTTPAEAAVLLMLANTTDEAVSPTVIADWIVQTRAQKHWTPCSCRVPAFGLTA